MKIAIRADGGSKIGMGHIMRTLVLAKELAKTNEVFYICRKDDPLTNKYKPGINMIKSEGFIVELIKEDSILIELKKIEADVLITDSYDVDENYFKETKKMFNKTGYIDDMNLYYFDVDFIINQNISALDFQYRVKPETKLFLGPQYIMLREEFRSKEKNDIRVNIKDIMITVGGADPDNVTGKLLSYIKDVEYNLHVVIGPSFGNIEKIKEIESDNQNIRLYFNPNMYEVMKKCDIAISACGSTIYELAACGIPTLGIVIAKNQKSIAKKMHEEKCIYNLGWYESINEDMITKGICEIFADKAFRKNIINNQIKLINKDGATTLSTEINKIIN